MKIRTGFVSNSSSSSFLLYGLFIGGADYNTCEAIEHAASKLGLRLYYRSPEYCGGCYVGLEWNNVEDNETGLEFRTRVHTMLQKIADYIEDHPEEIDYEHDFPKKIHIDDLCTYKEAWYS